MKINVMKVVGLGLLLTGAALAGSVVPAPEIDPGSAAVPFALLGGAVLIIRSRIRR